MNKLNYIRKLGTKAKKAAQDLIDSWELVGSVDGWEIVGAGHDADKWYFIAKTF